jgi:hypothetical protein
MRGGAGRTDFSRFQGVYWDKHANKWQAKCKKKYRGLYTTEEAAARAYSKYLKDGVVPELVERRGRGSSHFQGVSWNKSKNKWKTDVKGTHIGHYATEEDAARAYSKYLEDGINPVQQRSPHLALQGCLLEQAPQQMEGGLQGETSGQSRHGGRCGAGVQRRSRAQRSPPQRHPALWSRGRWRGRRPESGGRRWAQARCAEATGGSRDKQEDKARCFSDTCCTRAEHTCVAVGYLLRRGGRGRRHCNAVSEFG